MADAGEEGSPVVSVIVPAHNAAAYLGDALESLRTQTLTDIEVLVVDDGSTDETGSVARSYTARDPRFRVFRNEPASGRPGSARNIGLRAARGSYVALLDADDVAVPTRLENSVKALRATGASLAFGDFCKFNDSDGAAYAQAHLEGNNFVARAEQHLEPAGDSLFRCSPRFAVYLLTDIPAINTQTFMALREDLAAAGFFDETLVGSEDLDLFLRLVERAPVVYIDAVLTLMRVHPASLTATQTDRCALDAIQVRRAHAAVMRPRMTTSEHHAATRAIAGMLADLGYRRWLRGENANARAALADSLRLHRDAHTVLMYLKSWLPRTFGLRVRKLLSGEPV